MTQTRFAFLFIALSVLTLLACQTTDLISGLAQRNAHHVATRTPAASAKNSGSTPGATHDPNAGDAFVPASTPRCTVGDNSASVVTGRILDKNSPVVGQRVQASSGEGGEPISDEPAVTDQDGNFQVTFVCDGKACDGSFWIWLIDPDKNQTSPFVRFVFDNQCRRGTVNFKTP